MNNIHIAMLVALNDHGSLKSKRFIGSDKTALLYSTANDSGEKQKAETAGSTGNLSGLGTKMHSSFDLMRP
jgi:hypothetical protein